MHKTIYQNGLAVCCYIVLLCNLAIDIISALLGWEYEFQNKTLWLAVSAALLVMAVILGRSETEGSRRFLLIHVITYPAIFMVFILPEPAWIDYLLVIAVLVLSGILFKRAECGKKAKIVIIVLTVLIAIPTVLFGLFGFLLRDFGKDTYRYCTSPSGQYEAELRAGDQGALGGEVSVTVRQKDGQIALPFGTLSHPLYHWHSPDWMDPDGLEFRWDEEETITVNEETLHWRE